MQFNLNFLARIKKRPLMYDTLATTFLSALGKGVGFLVPFFIAAWFGITAETDAFFFVYGLVLFLAGIFASVVESVIVPYIAEARANNKDIGKFVGNILGFSSIGLAVLTVLFLLTSRLILPFVTGFSLASLKLVYSLLIEISPLIILLVCTSVLAGTLNSYKIFAFPAISPAIKAIINLAVIFAFKERFGVHSVAFGYVVGEIVQFIALFTIIERFNLFKLKFFLRFEPTIWEFLKTSSYQIIGMVAVGFNPVVDATMASWLGKGSVSVLHYADRLYMIPITFLTSGLTVVILSHWSSRYYESEKARLKQDLKKVVKPVVLIAFVVMGFLIVFYKPLSNLAFGRGAFDRARLPEIGFVWVCYLLGFVPYIWGQMYTRAFLVIKNTKILLKCALYMNFLNILLNLILMRFFKTSGIALSTSIVYVFSLVYLGRKFYKLTKYMEV